MSASRAIHDSSVNDRMELAAMSAAQPSRAATRRAGGPDDGQGASISSMASQPNSSGTLARGTDGADDDREAGLSSMASPGTKDFSSPAMPAEDEKVTWRASFLGFVTGIGGLMFGYVSGQISGFFHMDDFAQRFGQYGASDGQYDFDAVRQGAMVGLLCIGALIGSLVAGQAADRFGRRLTISAAALWSCVGTVIEISSQDNWAQFAGGRLASGLAIGALSVVVPMYQAESSPATLRGLLVSTYQVFITLGIVMAEAVECGTRYMDGSASWRIPNGLGFFFALLLGGGVLLLPESPRYACRRGRLAEAHITIGRLAGLDPHCGAVQSQVDEITSKLREEELGASDARWHDIVTAPSMCYRVMLGIALQAGQQLTGANVFFYFGTTIFKSTGLVDGFVTQIILGAVNVGATLVGLWFVARLNRRTALMVGAAVMMSCWLIYALVGTYALDQAHPENSQGASIVLVVFSCLFIVAFAMTWGPLVWAVVGELYPAKYRASAMAVATASNWLVNFLLSFFTRYIVDAIGYLYGMVFAACCLSLILIIYFFLIEPKDRSLEEIDTMYTLKVNPRSSAKWDGGRVQSP